MKDPRPINMQSQADVRASGWCAEARDSDGHVLSVRSEFSGDKSIVDFVREAMGDGCTVTIWPHEITEPSDMEDAG